MKKRVDIKTGFVCNNSCLFCVQAHKKELGNRSTKDIRNDLEQARRTCSGVVFTGGEVTIRDDILELVSYARELGFERIQLQSNSRRLAYKDFCQKLIDAGANEFSPALHGHIADLHDYLTRSRGSFKQTTEAIRNLKELDQYVITNSVIVKPNYRYAEDLAKLLVSLGVDQYQLAFVHAIGNADLFYDSMMPWISLAAPFIHRGLQVGIDAGISVMAEAMPYCHMQGYERYVSEIVIPPTEIRDAGAFDPHFEETRKTHGKQKFPQCSACKYDLVCEGPWKEYPERKGSHEFIPVKGPKVSSVQEVIRWAGSATSAATQNHSLKSTQ
jgi:MoaA/NifB/PqqE/SkfB family radical SAM enzyme